MLFKLTQVGTAAWCTCVARNIKSQCSSCVPVKLSASPRPKVDQSHVAVCEPGNRISVSRLMGTLLSRILQYVCHPRGASTQLRAPPLHFPLPLTHSRYRCHRLLWDFRQIRLTDLTGLHHLHLDISGRSFSFDWSIWSCHWRRYL